MEKSDYIYINNMQYLWHRWKIHEAILLALGKVPRMFADAVKKGNVSFNLADFLEKIVLADLMQQGKYWLYQDCGINNLSMIGFCISTIGI